MTNRELDELLQRALPGYSSVFAPPPTGDRPALHAFAAFGWQNQGTFVGWPRLEWHAARRYRFTQDPTQPFHFQRSTGEVITPETMDNDVPPEVYRSFGFPGADDLGNMFQFKRDFEHVFCGARNLDVVPSPQPLAANLRQVACSKQRPHTAGVGRPQHPTTGSTGPPAAG
jgi:hypothetical protein